MEIRGQRECKDCGQAWSYYETGSVACPNCGSLRSVGTDDRRRHTNAPVTLDLSEALATVDESGIDDISQDVTTSLREYVRKRGFIDAGELRRLDDQFLLAHELLQALDVYSRLRDPDDSVEYYVLSLLRGITESGRPDPEAVPPVMREARGLGYARAITEYRQDVTDWLDDHPDDAARRTLGTLREQLKRVEALQGDVDPETAEQLLQAAREIGTYLDTGDQQQLASARDRLSRLSDL
jgi:hypothetical protein